MTVVAAVAMAALVSILVTHPGPRRLRLRLDERASPSRRLVGDATLAGLVVGDTGLVTQLGGGAGPGAVATSGGLVAATVAAAVRSSLAARAASEDRTAAATVAATRPPEVATAPGPAPPPSCVTNPVSPTTKPASVASPTRRRDGDARSSNRSLSRRGPGCVTRIETSAAIATAATTVMSHPVRSRARRLRHAAATDRPLSPPALAGFRRTRLIPA